MHGTEGWSRGIGFGHGMFGQVFWMVALVVVVAVVAYALFSRK